MVWRGSERVKVTSSVRKDFLERVSFELGLEGMVGILYRDGAFDPNRITKTTTWR